MVRAAAEVRTIIAIGSACSRPAAAARKRGSWLCDRRCARTAARLSALPMGGGQLEDAAASSRRQQQHSAGPPSSAAADAALLTADALSRGGQEVAAGGGRDCDTPQATTTISGDGNHNHPLVWLAILKVGLLADPAWSSGDMHERARRLWLAFHRLEPPDGHLRQDPPRRSTDPGRYTDPNRYHLLDVPCDLREPSGEDVSGSHAAALSLASSRRASPARRVPHSPTTMEDLVEGETISPQDYHPGGLSLDKLPAPSLLQALRTSPSCSVMGELYIRVHPTNNTFTVATVAEATALALVKIQEITIDGKKYPVAAYIAPPPAAVKGVISRAYWNETPEQILNDLRHRNPEADIIAARTRAALMPVRTAGNLVTGTMYALFQKLGSARGVARSTKRKRTLASQNAFFVVGPPHRQTVRKPKTAVPTAKDFPPLAPHQDRQRAWTKPTSTPPTSLREEEIAHLREEMAVEAAPPWEPLAATLWKSIAAVRDLWEQQPPATATHTTLAAAALFLWQECAHWPGHEGNSQQSSFAVNSRRATCCCSCCPHQGPSWSDAALLQATANDYELPTDKGPRWQMDYDWGLRQAKLLHGKLANSNSRTGWVTSLRSSCVCAAVWATSPCPAMRCCPNVGKPWPWEGAELLLPLVLSHGLSWAALVRAGTAPCA
ncbi:hypothetical protein HPB49_000889 [Dermacentor silvarum]|uniref:Uncharacterized protein n=1 Tax=Dermacentor silvarum TaxID=543639 RepID=A0ACB8DLS7_DERSI|nr:hypothetical protein HPB49_000889 [Dermacentor silvarum]